MTNPFDETVTCSICGETVRTIGMDAHRHGAACSVAAFIASYRERGMAPLPGAIDPDPRFIAALQALGIELEYDAIRAARFGSYTKFEHGYVAPEWVSVALSGMMRSSRIRGLSVRVLAAVKRDPDLQVEIVVLHRLGGPAAVKDRLLEILEEARRIK